MFPRYYEVHNVYPESKTLPLTPFSHLLLFFFFSNIWQDGGQCSAKGLYFYLADLRLLFLVVCLFLSHLSYITIFCLVGGPHGMVRTQVVSLLVCVLGLSVSFFWSFEFPLILGINFSFFLTLVLLFSIYVALL